MIEIKLFEALARCRDHHTFPMEFLETHGLAEAREREGFLEVILQDLDNEDNMYCVTFKRLHGEWLVDYIMLLDGTKLSVDEFNKHY